MTRWADQTRRDLNRLLAMHASYHFDYNFGDSCTSYGLCPFMPLCTSPDPTRWHDTYSRRNWNPLHSNPEQEKT